MNMGYRSLWRHNLGRKNWGYKRRVCWGQGGVSNVSLSSIYFPSFSVFPWWWQSRGQIFDFPMTVGDRSWWSQNIGQKHWGYKLQACWGKGGVSTVTLLSIFYFPSFSVFLWCWWSGGEICDFSMTVGN